LALINQILNNAIIGRFEWMPDKVPALQKAGAGTAG
jgi:hypothetical protein